MHTLITTLSFVSNGASLQLTNIVSSGDIFLILFVVLFLLSVCMGLFVLVYSKKLVASKHAGYVKSTSKILSFTGLTFFIMSLAFLFVFGMAKFAFAQEAPVTNNSDNSKIELAPNIQAVVDGIDGTITQYPQWDLKNIAGQTILLKSVKTKSLNGNNFTWNISSDTMQLYKDKPDKTNTFDLPVPLSPEQSMNLRIDSDYDNDSALEAIGSDVLEISFTLEEICVVTGKVVDQYGNPLEAANVVFYDSEDVSVYETVTDAQGNYLMYILPSVAGHIAASYDGKFDNDSADFTCDSDINVNDIVLYDEKTLGMEADVCTGQLDKGTSAGSVAINNGTPYEIVVSPDGLTSDIIFKQRGLEPVSLQATANQANGYSFGNWYLDVDGTMPAQSSGILTADTIFFAKFIENPDTVIRFGGKVLSEQADMGTIAAGDYLVRGNGIKWTIDGSQVIIGEGSLTQNIVASPTTDNGCVFTNWMLDGDTLTDGQSGYFYHDSVALFNKNDASNSLNADSLDHVFNPVFAPSSVRYSASVSVSEESGQSDMGQVLADEGKSFPYSLGELSKWTVDGNKIIFCVQGSSFQQNAIASPYEGYVFDTWELDDSPLSDGSTGNMTADIYFVAKFKMGNPCNVNSMIANNMTDKGNASEDMYVFGENTNWSITDNVVTIGRGVHAKTLVAEPVTDNGYKFDHWAFNDPTGTSVAEDSGKILADTTFYAVFEQNGSFSVMSSIIDSQNIEEYGSVAGDYTVGEGTKWEIQDSKIVVGVNSLAKEITSIGNSLNGQTFNTWFDDSEGLNPSVTLGNISDDTSFYASFKQDGEYDICGLLVDSQVSATDDYGHVTYYPASAFTVGKGTVWSWAGNAIFFGTGRLAKYITAVPNEENGMKFDDWYIDSRGTLEIPDTGNVERSINFYSAFTQNGEYSVNFNFVNEQNSDYGVLPAEGLSVGLNTCWSISQGQITFGKNSLSTTINVTPVYDNGQVFDKWFNESAASSECSASGNISSSKTFYAQFKDDELIDVSADIVSAQKVGDNNADYGSVSTGSLTSVPKGKKWTLSTENNVGYITFGVGTLASTKAFSATGNKDNGQIFDKWFNDSLSTEECDTAGNVDEEKIFYAKFMDNDAVNIFVDIVDDQDIDGDYGIVSAGSLTSVPKGTKWSLLTENNVGYVTFGSGTLSIVKAFSATGNYDNGQIFENWYKESSAAAYCDNIGNITEEKTFYAKFKNAEMVNINLDYVDGQNSDYGSLFNEDLTAVPKGTKWTLSVDNNIGYITFGSGILEKDKKFSAKGTTDNGQIFDKWFNNSDKSSACLTTGSIDSDKTFYAQFKDDQAINVSVAIVDEQNVDTDYGSVSFGSTTTVSKGSKWTLSVVDTIGYVSFGTGSLEKTKAFSATGNKDNGQIFDKWFNDSLSTEECDTAGNVDEVKTFYAKFMDNDTVNISVDIVDDQDINGDYGIVSAGSLISVPKGTKWSLLTENNVGYVSFGTGSLEKTKAFSATGTTDNGQIFDSWKDNASASADCSTTGNINNEKTFFAQFKDDDLMTVNLKIVSSQGIDQGSISVGELDIPKGKIWAIGENKVNFDGDSSIIKFGKGSLLEQSIITSNTDNGYLFNKWYSDDGLTPLAGTSGSITSSPISFYVDFNAVTISGKLVVNQTTAQSQRRQILANNQTVSFNYQEDTESITCTTQADGSYKITGFPLGTTGNLTLESEIGYRLVDSGVVLDRKVDINGVPDKGIVFNVEKDINLEGAELDYYSLDELKIVTDDLFSNRTSSKYYNEFSNVSKSDSYIMSNAIWYSHSQGQYDPSSPDIDVLDSDCKCNFVDEDSVNNFMFLRIIGVEHDISGRSDTRPITFQTVNCLPITASYDTKDNGYWGSSTLRTFLNNTIYNKLADGFKSNIVAVHKYSNAKHSAVNDTQDTEDKLFALSYSEVTKSNTSLLTGLASWYGQGDPRFIDVEGQIYKWYDLNSINGNAANSVLSNISCNDGSILSNQYSRVWLRSAYVGDSGYLAIQKDGNPGVDTGWNAKLGCMPAFCF